MERSIRLEALHITSGIWTFVKDQIDDAYCVIERRMKLPIFRISRIVHVTQFNTSRNEQTFINVILGCGPRYVFSGFQLFAPFHQTFRLTLDLRIPGRPTETSLDAQNFANSN